MITLTIPGEPVAKGRPRMMKSGIAFTPTKTRNYETLVKELYIIENRDKPMLEGQLSASIYAYFTIPKSASKKNREKMLEWKIRPTKRPDLDNIAKAVLDALNGLAYQDDSQIVRLVVEKYYSDKPCVEVSIEEVTP
jgi:Holliday junction resolvase RusA-like endonuclease